MRDLAVRVSKSQTVAEESRTRISGRVGFSRRFCITRGQGIFLSSAISCEQRTFFVSRFFVDRSSHGRSHRDGNKDSLGLTRDFERRIADQRGMQFVGRGYFSLARYDRSTAVRRFGVLLDRVECFSKVEADCVVAFAPRVDDRFPVREASSPSVSFSFPAASPRTIAPENPARYIR